MGSKVQLINIKNAIPRITMKVMLCCLSLLFVTGCKNDLVVNADYKETIVIFGLLDARQPKQYIKINKAFLTDQQSVREVAQLADSVYFSDLKAELREEQTGKVIPLTAENVAGKNPGLFLNQPNFLYTTTEPINPNYSYQIHVENRKKGVKVNSRTDIVQNPVIFAPTSPFDQDFTISSRPNTGIAINMRGGVNARLYDVILDFEYEEFHKLDTNTKFTKKISWKILKDRPSLDRSVIKALLPSDLFFDLLTSQIEVRKDWIRRPKNFVVTYIGGGEELANYISVSRPSIGIVQKQTDYTNVNNGLGIFSSRNMIVSQTLPASQITHMTLSNEPKTAALGF